MERFRFGLFEFDPGTGELRREGTPVGLQSQPAKVLAILVEHAGEVVTRETLRKGVWGTGTFIDFDGGLNFCIAQIRAALGDAAESPRFIKTLPKRGYRFVAPVSRVAQPHVETVGSPPRSKMYLTAVVLAIAVAVVVLVKVILPSPEPILIAVTRFDNETGTPDFDRFTDGLTDSVVAELTASGRFGIIGNAAILRQPRAKRDLLAIGSSLKARYVVLGELQQNSSRMWVLAHLIKLPEQTHLWVTRVEWAADGPLGKEPELAKRIAAEFSRQLAWERNRIAASSVAVNR
jgi:DNA-binding winged helix-turn-helix (wHTH) protein/TolB-like protein